MACGGVSRVAPACGAWRAARRACEAGGAARACRERGTTGGEDARKWPRAACHETTCGEQVLWGWVGRRRRHSRRDNRNGIVACNPNRDVSIIKRNSKGWCATLSGRVVLAAKRGRGRCSPSCVRRTDNATCAVAAAVEAVEIQSLGPPFAAARAIVVGYSL